LFIVNYLYWIEILDVYIKPEFQEFANELLDVFALIVMTKLLLII